VDTSVRKNIAARDAAPARTGRVTRRVAAAARLVPMAGFAHLIPTRPPHLPVGGTENGGSGSGGSGTSSGAGAPGNGSGPSRVTEGGS
jgi:hypothetical protein